MFYNTLLLCVIAEKYQMKKFYEKVYDPLNGGDWGCIVRDLETIIVLVLLAFNFIPQRSHHSLTLLRSRIRDSATATLTPGDGTTAIKVESSVVMQKKCFLFFFYFLFFFLICLLIKYFIKMYSIDMNHMCISLGNG